jgi:hypothetical protein
MIYTHVLNRGGLGVGSPLDRLEPDYLQWLRAAAVSNRGAHRASYKMSIRMPRLVTTGVDSCGPLQPTAFAAAS